MDPRLWSELPVPLVEAVLPKLSFLSFIKLRTVCKQWNSFILSECPSKIPSPLKEVFLSIAADGRSLISYNTKGRRWHNLPLPFLGVVPRNSHYNLVGSDGGLICLQNRSKSEELIIYNPLTKSWKQLPSLVVREEPELSSFIAWDVAGLITEQASGQYKLIVVGRFLDDPLIEVSEENVCYKVTQVYDSLQGQWTMNFHNNFIRGKYLTLVGKALCNGCLYTLALHTPARQVTYFPHSSLFLLKYDLELKTWIEISVPFPFRRSFPDVFEKDGVVGLLAPAHWGVHLAINTWNYDPSKGQLVYMKSHFCPKVFCSELKTSPVFGSSSQFHSSFMYSGHDTRVSFLVLVDKVGRVSIVTHEKSTNTWERLPSLGFRSFVPQAACRLQLSMTAQVQYQC